jgi:seryl-tRNA(Sec) selenium transferase
LISLKHIHLATDELERALRLNSPPIIGRIAEDKVLLDLRTVSQIEEGEITSALIKLSTEMSDN